MEKLTILKKEMLIHFVYKKIDGKSIGLSQEFKSLY